MPYPELTRLIGVSVEWKLDMSSVFNVPLMARDTDKTELGSFVPHQGPSSPVSGEKDLSIREFRNSDAESILEHLRLAELWRAEQILIAEPLSTDNQQPTCP